MTENALEPPGGEQPTTDRQPMGGPPPRGINEARPGIPGGVRRETSTVKGLARTKLAKSAYDAE